MGGDWPNSCILWWWDDGACVCDDGVNVEVAKL